MNYTQSCVGVLGVDIERFSYHRESDACLILIGLNYCDICPWSLTLSLHLVFWAACLCPCSPNTCIKTVTLNGMVLGGGTFGTWLGLGEVMMTNFLHHVKIQWESGHLQTRKLRLPQHWILGVLSLQNCETCVLFKAHVLWYLVIRSWTDWNTVVFFSEKQNQ